MKGTVVIAEDVRQERASTRRAILARIIVVGVSALCAIILYAFLHESGHALAGLLFGGSITSFSIDFWDLSAHVGVEGTFSPAQRGLIGVAGAGCPLLIWAAYSRLVRGSTNAVVFWFTTVSSLAVINSLLPWIFLPLPYPAGQRPGDDVINFLNNTAVSSCRTSLRGRRRSLWWGPAATAPSSSSCPRRPR